MLLLKTDKCFVFGGSLTILQVSNIPCLCSMLLEHCHDVTMDMKDTAANFLDM